MTKRSKEYGIRQFVGPMNISDDARQVIDRVVDVLRVADGTEVGFYRMKFRWHLSSMPWGDQITICMDASLPGQPRDFTAASAIGVREHPDVAERYLRNTVEHWARQVEKEFHRIFSARITPAPPSTRPRILA